MRVIMVPGIDGSDSEHWQSHWERSLGRSASRIEPTSWSSPDLDDWCDALDRAVTGDDACVLIAHSLGCLASAAWLSRRLAPTVVAGALLVAPPDVDGLRFPSTSAPTFVGVPQSSLRLPALVLASSDDPYCSAESAAELAARWEAPLVEVGCHGHVKLRERSGHVAGRVEPSRGVLGRAWHALDLRIIDASTAGLRCR